MATNGVYIVMGEANSVVALLNKARRQYQLSQVPTLEDTDPLLRNFTDLKEVLNEVADLADMNPQTYLSPFLDVIKAPNTNGPITEAALAAVAKFLNYGLIDASSIKAANAVESIAYAVVHTKFIGGKSTGSDECVLFKILQVLRSLLLSPPGILLSNEAVCDMMQSCFRIVFEQNLSLLLRKAAESTLADMTQLIFTRLPTFVEDTRHPYIRQLVNPTEKRQKRKKKRQLSTHIELKEKKDEETESNATESTKLISASSEVEIDGAAKLGYDVVLTTDPPVDTVTHPDPVVVELKKEQDSEGEEAGSESEGGEEERPIRTHGGLQREIVSDEEDPLSNDDQAVGTEEKMPYGLPCCRELLRFLITMINPLDRHNTESMVVLGLNLLIVALEAVADFLPNYEILMPLIKNELCRSLLQLLDTEKLPVLAATNRCCFLLFESMRMHLKFQLESYLKKLQSIVLSEKNLTNSGTEQKEMALESLVQLWRIPGLVTEMYLNFDCDLYCGNIFEDLTKLLVENSFPTLGGHTASLLSLDALLVVIETIEQNCEDRENGRGEISKDQEQRDLKKLGLPVLSGYDIGRKMNTPTSDQKLPSSSPIPPAASSTILLRSNRHVPSENLPSMIEIVEQKKRKRLIAEGTELFNQSPKKGIAFLREKGILGHDEESLVQWLRANPQLDKKAIADYICNRKHAETLKAFVKSFPFENTRLDVALRIFLETFRLPGESAEISLVMQHFSEEWSMANNEPFNHIDAAFTLSYAIIMLNVDQHNPQAKRSQPPMTVDCFKKNLSGTNGSEDFDPGMLTDMYHAIKSEEIVMPAEQKGSVKEDYMWKVLLRRGETSEGSFFHAPTGWNDHDLFAVCWGPAVAALSYVFDKSEHEQILQKALTGYRKCAKISAYYGMKEVFDNLCIHLCKFTTLTSMRDGGIDDSLDLQRHRSMLDVSNSGNSSAVGLTNHSPEVVSLAFGENHKAQLATRTLFYLVHENGNILSEGWRNLCEVLLQLFRARLLPSDLIEVEDYVDEKGWVSIQRVHQKELPNTRNDSGLLSWFGLGGSSSEVDRRKPTQEQLSAMKLASQVIAECRPSQIVADSKYLTSTSLAEMLSAIAANSAMIVDQAEPQQKAASLSGEDEDALVFYLEIIVAITLENKDRLPLVWPHVRRHLEWLLSPRFGRCPVLVERAVVGLLRVANRNLFRDNTVSDDVLHSLAMLLRLSPKASFVFSRQIAFGLYELIRANAANVHKKEHWAVLFALLESAGAAVLPDEYAMQLEKNSLKVGADQRNAYSDVEGNSGRGVGGHDDRAYTSEGEERRRGNYDSGSDMESRVDSAASLTGGHKQPADWIHLDHKDAAKATEEALTALGANSHKKNFRQYGSLVLRNGLGRHEPAAFLKVCECLAFLLRDAVHVTPDNFASSLQCLRTMVEASLDGGVYAAGPLSGDAQNRLRSTVTDERATKKHHHHHHHHTHGKKKDLSTDVADEADDSRNEEQQLTANYQQMALHLLDLCSQLHSQTPAIFAKWAQQESVSTGNLASVAFIWTDIWRPLLQAMGRLSCDCRRGVRAAALTHLQRAFLPANMATLGAAEWQSCFGEVLFPLLTKLLESFSPMDPIGMEDTRVRTLQIVAKTLLNHLSALSALESFPDLWMLLLDYMEQYLRVDSCGNLNEAVPESLKNMLLVMDSTSIFTAIPGLYEMTVERLNRFMPQLIKDTIPNPPVKDRAPQPAHSTQQVPSQSEMISHHASGLEPPSSSTAATSSSEPSATQTSESATSVASTMAPPLTTCLEDASALSAPIPIQQPVVPLTEVIVHSGPTSPIGSPPQSHAIETPASSVPQQQQHVNQQQQYEQYHQHQHYPQYQNYQQPHYPHPSQQQYAYSPEAAAYYQQQYAQQQQQYAEHYASQYQQYQQQQQPVNPSVHGQFSVANPLPVPSHPAAYHPIVSPSANSAFSQVYASSQANVPPGQATSQESPYFTPIPYNPNQQQQP